MALDDDLDSVFDDPIQSPEPDPIKDEPIIDDFLNDDTIITKNESVLDDLLKSKGISDSKVVIINDNNEEEEVDFYSLSKDEQLQILNSSDADYDYGLDDSEIDFLNTLRSQGISIEQYLESYKQSIINEPKGDNLPNYEIDEYSDNELFLLDLQTRFDDFSEDELVAELEKELQNPDLFKRKVDKLRGEYKQLEDQYNQQKEEEFRVKQDQEYSQFVDALSDVAKSTTNMYDIELEDVEINRVLDSLTKLDENGTSDFYKSLSDPKKMYELAWFNLYGKDAFNVLANAYESKIKELEKQIDPKSTPKKTIVKNVSGDDQIKSIYHLS